MKFFKLGKVHTLSGTLLLSLFLARLMISTLCMYSISTGKSPMKLLLLMSKMVVVFNSVISSGRHPDRVFPDTTNSSSFPAISPMLLGRHPMSLLLDITTTEAGELPMFSGMAE